MEKTEEKDGRKYWVITLDPDELFNRVSRDSNYREHAMEGGGSRYILLDADRSLFDRLLKSCAGELWLKLGRMSKEVARAISYTEDSVQMRLGVTPNHDDNMLFTLGSFIEEFMEAGILREWYIRNNLADETTKCAHVADVALGNILTTVHYRKKAVRRPVDPVF